MRGRDPATAALSSVAALVVLAVIEIATFVEVVRAIGGPAAALLLTAISAAGLLLLRHEVVRGRRLLQAAVGGSAPVGRSASDSAVRLFGAVLVALPGFFSAALGLILLLPPSRMLIRRAVERSVEEQDDISAADLFGPRRVRAGRAGRRGGRATPADDAVDPRTPTRTAAGAIEGEILDGEAAR
ncbi:FxsA family protein [Actinoplanes sp. URMC 104]|uniref:FxsA family protein n=1 Tax=Actinoplanes sp. URMC 104 TaxID=3423409 RepID=UPI003F1DE81A